MNNKEKLLSMGIDPVKYLINKWAESAKARLIDRICEGRQDDDVLQADENSQDPVTNRLKTLNNNTVNQYFISLENANNKLQTVKDTNPLDLVKVKGLNGKIYLKIVPKVNSKRIVLSDIAVPSNNSDQRSNTKILVTNQNIKEAKVFEQRVPPIINYKSMQPPLVIKQGTTSGQVGIQPGMVTVPMTVNSSMPTSMPNVMALNKPVQNVVATTQNMVGGTSQPTILPNVQILNMRPGAPGTTQKSVAAVPPRVVLGSPQVVGTRAAAPAITLQTLQGLQPGQQGHLLLKTENGQYQLLRVGPAPAASTLTAPQAQTIRLSTVPTHPGVATASTSVATAPPIQAQLPAPPIMTATVGSTAPIPQQQAPPTVTTQRPSDNTKEKCRNFLANLLDLSSKEPKSVERNVRNLIQELIDTQVEPEEFCDRLERLLNASPQPCLIGFLKKSLPLLRQSLVTKELVIEGIHPPSVHVAFSTIPAPVQSVAVNTSNMQQLMINESCSTGTTLLPISVNPVSLEASSLQIQPVNPINIMTLPPMMAPGATRVDCTQMNEVSPMGTTLTTLMPIPISLGGPAFQPQPVNPINIMSTSPMMPPAAPRATSIQQKQIIQKQSSGGKSGNAISVLQNIPVQTQKINVNKMQAGKAMTINNKSTFARASASSATTIITPGKSLIKEKKSFSSPFPEDKMAGDDDINDVAAMGGVNLAEESQRILGSTELIGTQIRSCKDEHLVSAYNMQARLKAAMNKGMMEECSTEVANLMSHAVHEYLKNMIEKLASVAQHRIDLAAKHCESRHDITQDIKGQLKFLEELDKVDKKRREDSEREILMRAAKSRSKNEDPEQAKLKAKAKEMQRAELEEMRQREANLTALQAIGPRKKPRLEGVGASGDSAVASTSQSNQSFNSRSQLALRSRLKRINHRDLIYLMEQETATCYSTMLYRSYLK